MSAITTLRLADSGEVADLAGFIARLLRYDRAAAVRLQAAPAAPADRSAAQPGTTPGGVLAAFGRLPLGGSDAVAVRTARLIGAVERLDATVSAGQLLDSLDEEAAVLGVPPTITGPAWAGLLPPRTGWARLGSLPAEPAAAAVARAVTEFRTRSEALGADGSTRAALDALADEIWSRPLQAVPELPQRALHAAQVLGFLRPGATLSVFAAGSWLRLSAPYGSVAVRRAAAPGSGLGLTPLL